MMAVRRCEVCGWWYVSFDKMNIAKFRTQADANMYCQCCIASGHAEHATLASGLLI